MTANGILNYVYMEANHKCNQNKKKITFQLIPNSIYIATCTLFSCIKYKPINKCPQ